MTLQNLYISNNSLDEHTLDELIEMLNINTTIREVYLTDNPYVTSEYREVFRKLSNRFRKIYT